MSLKTFIAFVLVGLVAAGCASTRQGEPPDVPVADSWSYPVGPGGRNTTAWWEQFESPELNRIVRTALASNANLAILVQRVELARAEGRLQTAGSLPVANADTSLRAGKQRRRWTDFETESILPWSTEAIASWELDWLGKWRHRSTAASESIKAGHADLVAGELILTAEAVTTWFRLQRHHHEVATLRRVLDCQTQILDILRDRHSAGIIETVALDRQHAEISDFQRQAVEAEMRRQISARKLDRLQGRSAERSDYAVSPWTIDTATPAIPGILPVEALRRRPDLAAAEARLRAAWSIERAAKLDLYPSLDLRLGGFTLTSSLTDPFRAWMTQIGPRVQIPLWDPDRRAAARNTSARAQLAATEYRAAAIRAVEEIEAALITHHRTREQLDHAMKGSQHADNVVARTSDRRRAGLVSDLEVLADQSRALNARLTVIRVQSLHFTTIAAVYAALGV